MIREIRIYAEGGGDSKETKANLRRGLGKFLSSLKLQARNKRIKWSIVACGTRTRAYEWFQYALSDHPDAHIILLVDSEGPLNSQDCWEYLESLENWSRGEASTDQCFLMVQCMESWIVADLDSLGSFYGHHFNRNVFSDWPNVEEVAKDTLFDCLKRATQSTQKGEYHKTRHAPKLLGMIRPSVVRNRAPHCDEMLKVISDLIS